VNCHYGLSLWGARFDALCQAESKHWTSKQDEGNNMESERLHGRGRLVPTLPTGLEYQVAFEIDFPPMYQQPGRRLPPNHRDATRCCVTSSCHHLIPNGRYFLHVDVGQIHQLESVDRKWHYLATR
jgi:hypothetical protein